MMNKLGEVEKILKQEVGTFDSESHTYLDDRTLADLVKEIYRLFEPKPDGMSEKADPMLAELWDNDKDAAYDAANQDMGKPTKEKQKKFWGWCGLTYLKDKDGTLTWYDSEGNFVDFGYPDIDLNNLFLYAVPIAIKKLQEKNVWTELRALHYLLQAWELEYTWRKTTLEDALFWALDKVKEVEK